MDYDVADLGPCKKRVQVRLEAAEVNQEFDRSYSQLRKQVVLPGFRPGRTPRRVLERRFGDHVRGEVIEEIAKKNIEEIVTKLELKLVSPPELVDEKEFGEAVRPDAELTFSFEVETKGDFELPDYKGLEATRRVRAITDEDVEHVIAESAKEFAEWQPVEDGTCAAGDLVVADIVISRDGNELAKFEEERFVGDSHVVGDFHLEDLEAALEGKSADDTIDVTAHSHEQEGESPVKASIKLLEFKRQAVPDVDDELAGQLGKENLDELRADVREKMLDRAQAAADDDVVQQVFDKLIDTVDIPLAEGPVERMLEGRLRHDTIQLVIQGVDRETAQQKMEEERPRLREKIARDARCWLLVEKISAKEKIFALEEDVDEKIDALARENGTTPTRIREQLEEREGLAELRNNILEQKVCSLLRKHAKITEEKEAGGEPEASDGESEATTE